MGLHQEAQQTFQHYCRFNNGYDAISAPVRLEKDELTYNISHMGGHIRGIPTDNKGLRSAYIMGDPGKRASHSQNKEEPAAGTCGVPALAGNVERENKIDIQITNLRTDHPLRETCPYVLEGNHTPPSTPSSRCKSPFVPSFKDVAKVLTFPSFIWAKVDAFIERLNKWSRNADGLVEHFWAHMKLGGSMSETVWGKLSLGTKIVAQGGVEKMFKLNFSVGPTEKLLKTSACYLSTSRGPVAGLLFISTEKVAFCSERPLSFTCSQGGSGCSYYRVVIPLGRVRSVNLCENESKPSEKSIQIQTIDNHEFWFMAFVNYEKAFKHIERAVTSH